MTSVDEMLAAHKALIEAAIEWREGRRLGIDDAIDAYRDADPAGATLARLAEIGEAVERLGGLRALSLRAERILDLDDWAVTLRWWPADAPPPHYPIDRTGQGPTLPAAIAAAQP